MRGLSLIVALCTGVAVATAFSVTPNFAVGLSGTGDEVVTGVVADNFGGVYVSGWTNSALINTSFINGGPTGKTHYGVTYMRLAEAENGFVTKFNVYGIPVWSVAIGGATNDRANAIAINADQTIAYVCGTYTGSDAKIYPTVGTAQSLAVSLGGKDAFVAAINASTGAYVWSFAVQSVADDECFAIAERNGRVAYGGYGLRDPTNSGAAAGQALQPEGSSSNAVQSANTANRAVAFVGLANTDDGLARYISKPTLSHYAGDKSLYPGMTRALTFDSYGNLWVASSIELFAADIGAMYSGSTDGQHDINVVVYNAAALTDVSAFENYGAGLDCIAGYTTNPALTFEEGCVKYPSELAHGIDYVANFGSNGDDIVTGIAVQNAANNVTTARVVLTGYTVGAAPGSKFRVRTYTESGDAVRFADWAPATALDFDLTSDGEVGWWMANKATFSGETGAGFFAKALPPGVSGRVTGVACDALSMNCFASASLQGFGLMAVSGVPKNFSSTMGSRDAVMMRFDANGNILWMEQSGSPLNDTGDAVAYYYGAGVIRPGPYSVLGGSFRGTSLNTMASASPVVIVGRGGRDGSVVVYDDIDDCGLDPLFPANQFPYGPNACGVKVGNLTDLGASMCLDEPGFPLCFCHMNVTDGTPGTFCNRRGWNCKFMAQYYFGLLDMCDCPPAAQPHANPLLDIEGRLQLCSGSVCSFGQLTGVHSQCLPLVLDLMNFCGASPDTSATDQTYITLFKGFYAGCNAGTSSSSTGADECTGFDFCAAPRASTPASGVVTVLATAAAALLIAAANSRRE